MKAAFRSPPGLGTSLVQVQLSHSTCLPIQKNSPKPLETKEQSGLSSSEEKIKKLAERL